MYDEDMLELEALVSNYSNLLVNYKKIWAANCERWARPTLEYNQAKEEFIISVPLLYSKEVRAHYIPFTFGGLTVEI